MRIFTEFPQYSDLYWALRRGRPSSSNFGRILTPVKAELSAGADAYAYELIAERLPINRPPFEITRDMQHGILQEPESRRAYALMFDADVVQVGGCLSDCERFWCSPDGLVGSDGCLELKNPAPETHIAWLIEDGLPAKYKGQVHGQLIVTGREWVDFVSYCPPLPLHRVRVTPDAYTAKLRAGLDAFHERYMELLSRFDLSPLPTPAELFGISEGLVAA